MNIKNCIQRDTINEIFFTNKIKSRKDNQEYLQYVYKQLL